MIRASVRTSPLEESETVTSLLTTTGELPALEWHELVQVLLLQFPPAMVMVSQILA